MQVYLVGGAVRDELLGLEVSERDYVVVGARPEDLERRGFRRVGKDFPVFLEPDTGEEYALARTERKTASGYKGFSVDAGPEVTLEDDLLRRDLTINAMARDADGRLVDPYGGRRDLEDRVLRHVSPAFVEDPVRVLRAARFAARFHELGFRVAPETLELMQTMSDNGEVDALVPERVWRETERALMSERPAVFFETLRACAALERIYPEVDRLFGVPQPPKWHPEIDTGVHTMMVLQQAVRLNGSLAMRFAALTHDLGKGTTPADVLPSHHGHEARSVDLIKALCARLRVPNPCRDLALVVAEHHGTVHRAHELRPSTILKLFGKTDALRRPERFDEALLACEADARGRTGLEDSPYPQRALLRGALDAVAAVDVAALDLEGLAGPAIGKAIYDARLRALKDWLGRQKT